MKLKLTFTFDDNARAAIALHLSTKKPATRTQVVQWMTTVVAEQRVLLEEGLRQHRMNPNLDQQSFTGMIPAPANAKAVQHG